MSNKYLLAAAGCLLLASCSKPPEEYRLTSQQLAWQPYQTGQQLRFAQRPAGPVRAYRISNVADYLERQNTGINFTILPSRKIDCQHVEVRAQRTDTTAQNTLVLNYELGYYAGDISLRAAIGWDKVEAYQMIPLDSIIKGVAFDSLQYPGVRRLQTAAFGGTTYGPVLRVLPYLPPGPPARGSLRAIYFAKGAGVVAFEETGAGLWYRLP